jgi:hypothetical protein
MILNYPNLFKETKKEKEGIGGSLEMNTLMQSSAIVVLWITWIQMVVSQLELKLETHLR